MIAVQRYTDVLDGEELSDDLVAVAENFVRLMRSFARTRAQILAAAAHDVEWSAQMVLRCVENSGPMRSGAIAECVQADPSTVSRQVAALVKDGLLERRADPEDGRASLLVLTEKAGAVLKSHDDLRNQHFAQMLADWNERDLRKFADLMARFTRDYESASAEFLSGRVASNRRPAEGNH
jgi:DNA-binding MarR family transcriptional regulator